MLRRASFDYETRTDFLRLCPNPLQGPRAQYGRNPSPPRVPMYATKRAGSLVGAGTGLVRRSSSVAEATTSLVSAHSLLHQGGVCR